jgi:hypothetical protein
MTALEAYGRDVLVQRLFEQVMHRHLVLFSAFFMESQPSTWTIVISSTLSFSTALTRAKL